MTSAGVGVWGGKLCQIGLYGPREADLGGYVLTDCGAGALHGVEALNPDVLRAVPGRIGGKGANMGDGHDEDDGHGDDEGRSADAAHVEATGEDAGRDAPMAADGAGLRREGRCGAGEDGLREAGMACTAPVGRCGRTVSV